MISTETIVEVRYNETDSMGYVYHGNYPAYYHVARGSLLKKLGIDEQMLEDEGILLPVIEMKMQFLKPAFFDEKLRIKASLIKITETRLYFNYEIYNASEQLINTAESTLVFVDKTSRKPMRAPMIITQKLNVLFKN